MRPWTAIILSDYGRDRLAYQAYEKLFDPVLPPQSLPVSSRHIRRIQAVYALIDYLGLNGPDGRSRGHTWGDLAGQHLRRADWDQRRTFLIRRLVAMLEREADSEALANHLAQALQLPPEDIAPLLWEHPNRISKTTGCGTRLSPSLAWAIVRRFEHAGSPDREKRPPYSMC